MKRFLVCLPYSNKPILGIYAHDFAVACFYASSYLANYGIIKYKVRKLEDCIIN